MTLWLTMLAAGLLTFLTRLSFIALLARWVMPPLFQRALGFVPPAVLTAIIFPELLLAEGELVPLSGNYRLLAGIIAALLAWKTRKVLPTILAGMAALWLMRTAGA